MYDGLTLLRVDQLYDSDEDEELEMTDGWRVWWENTTMPALLGGLLAKRVYSYPNDQSGTSNGSTDFYYAHDAIGNVVAVSDGNGDRQHHFTQDAFGNELTLDSLGGDDWNAAHEDGIWEHQTGKWFDPETELYFFHARWVDPVVGRFVGRSILLPEDEETYAFCMNSPTNRFDPDGHQSISPPPTTSVHPHWWRCIVVCGPLTWGIGQGWDKFGPTPSNLSDFADKDKGGRFLKGAKPCMRSLAKILGKASAI